VFRRTLPKLVFLATFALTPAASAGDGAAQTPGHGGAGYGELQPPRQTVDPKPEPKPEPKPKPKPKREPRTPKATRSGGNPLLTSFSVSASRVYLFGRAARVRFQINDRADVVSADLVIVNSKSGEVVRRIDLGQRTTGVTHTYRFTGREGGALSAGRYRVRVRAKDPAGNPLVRAARTSAVDELGVFPFRFPLKGNFPYGDPGSRFGAPRSGHKHQGQDIGAPLGTQIRAARGGRVKTVAFQASGAGHYVVIDAAGQTRDYVYMHMQTGSVRVRQGQWVKTGQWIGNVGNTGASFGAHLHFEIWQGTWWGGGEPIDPYPSLRNWDRWS